MLFRVNVCQVVWYKHSFEKMGLSLGSVRWCFTYSKLFQKHWKSSSLQQANALNIPLDFRCIKLNYQWFFRLGLFISWHHNDYKAMAILTQTMIARLITATLNNRKKCLALFLTHNYELCVSFKEVRLRFRNTKSPTYCPKNLTTLVTAIRSTS